MTLSLEDQLYFDFLAQLEIILNNAVEIDFAFHQSKITHANKEQVGLSTLDAYGIFDDKGQIDPTHSKAAKVEINPALIMNLIINDPLTTAEQEVFKKFSLRDQLILGAASNQALRNVLAKYKSKGKLAEVNREQKNKLTQGELEGKIVATQKLVMTELSKKLLGHAVMTSPTSCDLVREAKDALNMGHHTFTGTNIFISPGPQTRALAARDLANYARYRETQLTTFFRNLEKNRIQHVFAIGMVFPHFAPDDPDFSTVNIADFCNYFIPDQDGFVKLPQGFSEHFKVASKVVGRFGRFTVYEIHINNGPAIQVHHLPVRGKKPLDLTDVELSHVQEVQDDASTPSVLTHCYGDNEKGRSAQMAYILALQTDVYRSRQTGAAWQIQQLADMCRDMTGEQESTKFIEARKQQSYILSLTAGHLATPRINQTFVDTIQLLMRILKNEIDVSIAMIGSVATKDKDYIDSESLTEEQRNQIQLIEYYYQLQDAINVDDALEIIRSIKLEKTADSVALGTTETFRSLLTFDDRNIFIDRLKAYGIACASADEPTQNDPSFFDIIARQMQFTEARRHFLAGFATPKATSGSGSHPDIHKIGMQYLLQGFLRAKPPFVNELKDHLTAEIQFLKSALLMTLKEFKQNRSQDVARNEWKLHAKLFQEIQESAKLFATLEPNVNTDLAYLAQCFDVGLDALQLDPTDDKVVFPRRATIVGMPVASGPVAVAPLVPEDGDLALEEAAKRQQEDDEARNKARILREMEEHTASARDHKEQLIRKIQERIQLDRQQVGARLKLGKAIGSAPFIHEPMPREFPLLLILDIDQLPIEDELLCTLLKSVKANLPGTQIAICTNRSEVNGIVSKIKEKTGVEIRRELQCALPDVTKSITQTKNVLTHIQEGLYTALSEQQVNGLLEEKNPQLFELRKRHESTYGRLPRETDCILVVANNPRLAAATRATTDFCVVAMPGGDADSTDSIRELTYRLGLFNPLVQLLNGRPPLTPADFSKIPNIERIGFKRSPLVRQVGLTTFIRKVKETFVLPENKELADSYIYDFTMSAVEDYKSLPPVFQAQVESEALVLIAGKCESLYATMRSLVGNARECQAATPRLLGLVNALIQLEEKYHDTIGETYLKHHLFVIRTAVKNLTRLQQKDSGAQVKISSTAEQSISIYLDEFSCFPQGPLVREPDTLTRNPDYGQLRVKFKTSCTNGETNLIRLLVKKFNGLAIVAQSPMKPVLDNINYSDLLAAIQSFIPLFNLSHALRFVPNIRNIEQELLQIETLLINLKKVAPAIRLRDRIDSSPARDYEAEIQAILEHQFNPVLKTVKAHQQHRAMQFLDRAAAYIASKERSWYGRNPPQHVVEQLGEIEAANKDGDYAAHMAAFTNIGRTKAGHMKLFTSTASDSYSKLFEGNNATEVMQKLVAAFK